MTVDEVPEDVDLSYNCNSEMGSNLSAQEHDDCDDMLVRDAVSHDDHDIDEEPDTVVDEQPDQFDVEVQPLCQVSLCVS